MQIYKGEILERNTFESEYSTGRIIEKEESIIHNGAAINRTSGKDTVICLVGLANPQDRWASKEGRRTRTDMG